MDMIPRILHQTWMTETIPDEWVQTIELSKGLYPDWDYRLWTDHTCRQFVLTEFPELLEVYDGYPRGIMRADIVRYMWMYRFGGVYFDLDYEFTQPFDWERFQLVLPQSRSLRTHRYFRIGNCVFGSVAGHRFWEFVFDDLRRAPRDLPPSVDVEEITGPGMLTRVFNSLPEGVFPTFSDDDPSVAAVENSIYYPDSTLFHPGTPRSEGQRLRMLNDEGVYGIHYCGGSWRDPVSLPRRVVNKGRRIWQDLGRRLGH